MSNWWDCLFDDFKEIMAQIGVKVDHIYFSGFCSQGDGACFVGRIRDWPLYLGSLGYNNPVLARHASTHWQFRVGHKGRYYSDDYATFDYDIVLPCDGDDTEDFIEEFSPYPGGDIRSLAWLAALRSVHGGQLATEFEENLRFHMSSLYKRLEAEHEYITSGEED